jgi:hypothetical protein
MKKILWFIKGHLIWKTGKSWLKYQQARGEYTIGTDLGNRKLVSAYEYWKKYSISNG